jgi:hypothetical protein
MVTVHVLPTISLIPIDMQHHMVVIVHDVQDVVMQRVHGCTGAAHSIGADIDGKDQEFVVVVT